MAMETLVAQRNPVPALAAMSKTTTTVMMVEASYPNALSYVMV